MEANGYWELLIEHSGKYLIQLQRWPKEASRPINGGISGDDIEWKKPCIMPQDWHIYTGGKAILVENAKLEVGSQSFVKPVSDCETSVDFIIQLPKGQINLQTWLENRNGLRIGAYYIYIKRIS